MTNLISVESKIVKSAICRVNTFTRPFPTLFYFPGLSSKQVWNKNSTKSVKILEDNYSTIKKEFEEASSSNFLTNDYHLIDKEQSLHNGTWEWFSLVSKGKLNNKFAETLPKTHEIIMSLEDLMTDVPFAYTFFSSLENGAEIAPHYGPCNIRLRLHLGIDIPIEQGSHSNDNSMINEKNNEISKTGKCRIEIGEESYCWKNGECILFDDTYIHSVHNYSGKKRVILLIDIWHPEIYKHERQAIIKMFNKSI